jgi:tetratricopeptide (TPR) repeat protein
MSETNEYIPNTETQRELDDFVDASGEDADRVLVITGENGMEKSAFLANWVQTRRNNGEKILHHLISNAGFEGDYRYIIGSLINKITQLTGLPPAGDLSILDGDAPMGADALTENLQNLLWAAAKKEKLILVLEGMEKIDDTDNAKLLNWLPAFPPNVRLIFSTLAGDKTTEAFKRRRYPCIELEPLPVTASPSAPDLESFYDMVLDRLEKTYSPDTNKGFAGEVLALLAASRAGLNVPEILGISGADPLSWSQLYNGMPEYLAERNGLIVFNNRFMQEAVTKRYLKEGGEEYHRRIVSYIKTTPDIPSGRKCDELPYQYFMLKEWVKLYTFLVNFEVFDYIYTKNEYELGVYWSALQRENKKRYSPERYLVLYYEGDPEDRKTVGGYYYKIGCFVLTAFGNYDLALKIFQKALFIREKTFGREHLDTALSFNSVGLIYSKTRYHDEALESYQKVLVVFEKVFGPEHPSTAISYNNIGLAYANRGDHDNFIHGGCMGDFAKALEFFKKALAVREKIFGLEHPSVVYSYNNIGMVYKDMENYKKALESLQKALALGETVFGPDHPDIAASYTSIGEVYHIDTNYEKALECYQKALAIREKDFGLDHPITALSYTNIGEVYFKMKNHEKALEFYHKDLAINEKVFGPVHNDIAISYSNISLVYNDMGNYEKALESLQKSYASEKSSWLRKS